MAMIGAWRAGGLRALQAEVPCRHAAASSHCHWHSQADDLTLWAPERPLTAAWAPVMPLAMLELAEAISACRAATS